MNELAQGEHDITTDHNTMEFSANPVDFNDIIEQLKCLHDHLSRDEWAMNLIKTEVEILKQLVDLGLFEMIHLWLVDILDDDLNKSTETDDQPSLQIEDPESMNDNNKQYLLNILNVIKVLPLDVGHLKQFDTGKRLRKLSKHSDKEISELSKEIMTQWRNIISETNQKLKNSIKSAQGNNSPKTRSTSQKTTNFESPAKRPKNFNRTSFNSEESLNYSILRSDTSIVSSNKSKSVSFANNDSLIEYHYFEIDENTASQLRNYQEARKLEHSLDRNANKHGFEIESTEWYTPVKLDNPFSAKITLESKEKLLQEERIRGTLKEIFFNNKNNSAFEPLKPSNPDPDHVPINIPIGNVSNRVPLQAGIISKPPQSLITNHMPLKMSPTNMYTQTPNKLPTQNFMFPPMPLFPGHPMMMPGAFPMISPNFPVNQNLMGQKNFPHQMMPQIQQQQKNTENQPQISSANSIQQNLNLILNNANNNFAAMQKNLINPMQTKPQSPSSVEKSKILDQKTPPQSSPKNSPSNKACSHYMVKGWCKFRDKCQFSHEINNSTSTDAKPQNNFKTTP